MADETPPADPNEELRATLAARERDLAAAQARLGAMEETFQALNRPQPQAPLQPPPGKHYVIPPHIRQQIAGGGLTDQEIEANGDLIVPFINAYLGQAAQEVLAIIQQQADEIEQLHMVRDVEAYPHAETLFKDMKKIRQAELKAGRYINPETAYRLAVANNYERLGATQSAEGGQFDARREPQAPTTTRSHDASAGSSLRSVRGPVTAPERTPTRGDDLMQMSREERRAFFEANGDTPIVGRQ